MSVRQCKSQCIVIVVAASLIPIAAVQAAKVAKHTTPTTQVLMRRYRQGQWDAQQDLRASKFIIKSYGLPAPGAADAECILWRDYKIKIEEFGCMGGDDDKVAGYNQVMHQAIEQKYGKGLLERIYRCAERGDYRPLPHVIRGKAAQKPGQSRIRPKIIRVPAH